jgi:peptidyl-prolyl cis-trans isomerase D
MFDFFRSHKRLLQFILVVLIVPSFVFFGVQGYSRFSDESFAPVAEVSGRNITRNEWEQAHQRSIENFRRQMPGVDVKLFDTPEMKQQTLDAMVREQVMLAVAASDHLAPGDERLSRLFRADPQFAGLRNADGSINRDLLTAQGMTSDVFEQQLRTELAMRQVLGAVEGTAIVPKATVRTSMDALMQRRQVQWQRFAPSEFAARVQPTEAELEAFHKDHAARFLLPESAAIEYAVLDLDTVKRGISVTEEDLRRHYDENASRYTQAEERRASHILISSDSAQPAGERQKARAKAEGLLEDLRRAPARFAELARKESQDPGSAGQGGDLDYFSRGAMVKPFEDAVYGMKVGEISAVVETDFGYHIIRLDAVRGGQRRPFEAVKAEIESEVRAQLAQGRFAEAAEQFTNTVFEQSDSLQPAADKLKLQIQRASVSKTPGPDVSGLLASARLLEAVFAEETVRERRNTQAIDLGGSRLVSARVVQHSPARTPPLADIRDQVRAAVIAEKAAVLARQEGEARLAAAKADQNLKLAQAGPVSRAQAQTLGSKVVDAILQAPAGKLPAVVGADLGAEGYVVARVMEVLPREAADQADAIVAPQFTQAWAAAESQAYFETLKKRTKVEVKPLAKTAAAATP